MDVSGKTIVVLGGAGLIGRPLVRTAAERGAKVVSVDTDGKRGPSAAEECGAEFQQADTTDAVGLLKIVKKISTSGKIDGVVNATYPRTSAYGKPFEQATMEDMLENVRLHVSSALATAKTFGALMQEQKSGSIVFLGSIYGISAPRFEMYKGTSMTVPAEYAAAKGAVIALTRYFAALFGPDGVRVNAVSPGGVANEQPEAFAKAYGKHVVLGEGMLKPEDVVGAVLFLLSDPSEKVTGQNIVVDAGWTL